MQMPPVPTQMYIAANTMQYYNGQRAQTFVQPAAPVLYQGPSIPSQFSFPPNPNQTQAVPCEFSLWTHFKQLVLLRRVSVPFYSMRQGHPSQSASVPPNANQPLPNMQMTQQQPPFPRQQNKRRAKAIPVIDPDTGTVNAPTESLIN